MKIGFDAKRFFHNSTGLGNYSRDLIRIVSKYYPENHYFLYNPKKNKKKTYSTFQNTERIPEKAFWKKFKNLWRTLGIKNQLLKDKIEIYHGLSGEIPLFLPKQIKKVVTIHDLIFIRYPNLYSFWDRKIHYFKFKYAAKNADIVIAISEQTKKDIIQFLKINPEKIKVIYQGCAEAFKKNLSEIEKEKVIEKFNLPKEFLLNVGTIEPRKNLLTIIKSIKNIDAKLVVIGKKTKYYNEVHDYILQNNLEKKVIFLNNVSLEELATIYQLATIFIYPSIFEGFGIPIIEALFSKTPVITTNNGVFPEAGGKDSIYVNPLDSEELKNEISKLLKNSELRNLIADKGYLFVQKFSDDSIAKQVMDVYLSLKK